MFEATISSRYLNIKDDEIVARASGASLEFITHKEKNGDYVVVALKTDSGFKSYETKKGVKYNLPSTLKKYKDKKIICYVERIRPLDREVFRIFPLDFDLKTRRGRKTAYHPYFKKGVIFPQMFINTYIKEVKNDLCISFGDTNRDTLTKGYIIGRLVHRPAGKVFQDEYRLHECATGLRTNNVVHLVEFLERNNLNLTKYKYEGILQDDGVVILFKETL